MRQDACSGPRWPFWSFPRALPAGGAAAFDLNAAAPAASAPASAPRRPAGPRLYVSDETGGIVVVIDPESGQIVERIAVGKRPRGLRISRDGRQLLVALSGNPIAGPGVDESKLPAGRSRRGRHRRRATWRRTS